MINDETYRQWTDVFSPGDGSSYEGEWITGHEISFLGIEKDGKRSGMYAKVKEARPYDFISIQHLGEVSSGVKKPWTVNAFEEYTFQERPDGTILSISVDVDEKWKQMFEETWPIALEKLKQLSEK